MCARAFAASRERLQLLGQLHAAFLCGAADTFTGKCYSTDGILTKRRLFLTQKAGASQPFLDTPAAFYLLLQKEKSYFLR